MRRTLLLLASAALAALAVARSRTPAELPEPPRGSWELVDDDSST
ncbi:MAG: hypothetical protein QGD89_04030 [Actinomycetota bacterium]|nr:hypothetical protein [Actinomycetota bacterium]